ncbi:MAG: hypothetical protein WC728_03810 [Elusimicrobiota bacterium]
MARTNTSKLKLPKHDVGDLNWGQDFNEGLDAVDAHCQREVLRPPRTLAAVLASGAVGPYLAAGTTYFYKVTALNAVGETTEGRLPVVLEASLTQGATPVPVQLEWEAVEGATGYRVYKGSSGGAEEFLAEVSGGSTVTYTDTGNTAVTPGQTVPSSNTARESVTGIRKLGEAAPLRGDVKLEAGDNVTLTQDGAAGKIGISVPSATPSQHALAGSEHSASTVAELNTKLTDGPVPKSSEAVLQSLADAKGDLAAASGPDAWSRLPAGADGKFLKANSAAALGLEWADAGGGAAGYATVVVAAPTGVAVTDTANIQAAINALPAGGGTVVLREGTYALNAAINLPSGKPVWIHGQGRATRLQGIAGANYHFRGPASGGMRGIVISDLMSDGTNASAIILSMEPGAGAIFEDIKILRCWGYKTASWVYAFVDNGRTVRNVEVAHCSIEDGFLCFMNFIGTGVIQRVMVHDNKVVHVTAASYYGASISLSGTAHIIKGNQIVCNSGEVNGAAIRSAGGGMTDTIIENNYVKYQQLFAHDAGQGYVRKCIISDNVNDADAGMDASINLGNAEATDTVVTGNRCTRPIKLQTGAPSGGNVVDGNDAVLQGGQASDDIGHVPQNLAAAKGDIVAASAAGAWSKVAAGSDGQILTADAASAAGVKWAAAGGAGGYATVVVAAPTGVPATDRANIQAALDSITTNGGTVVLREGTYVIDQPLTAKKRTTVKGQGGLGRGSLYGGTTINAQAQGFHFKLPTGVDEATDIAFLDMVWTGGKANGATFIDDSVVSGTARGIHFERIVFRGQVPVLGTSIVEWSEVFFHNCYFDPPSGTMQFGRFAGISTQHWVFSACWFRTATVELNGGNGTENQGGNHLMTGCVFDGMSDGAGYGALRLKCFFSEIAGCSFKVYGTGTQYGVYIERDSISLANCFLLGTGSGTPRIGISNMAFNCVVSGNKCSSINLESGATGNVVVGNKAAITDNSGAANTITGNG